jgi:hypothetical protein
MMGLNERLGIMLAPVDAIFLIGFLYGFLGTYQSAT